MSAEVVEGKAEFVNKKSGFSRLLVDKIRNIDVKWILAGITVGGVIFGLTTDALLHNQFLSIGALGISIVATGLLFCATDALDIAPRH